MSKDSPFVPGARVALEAYGRYTEHFVDKVLANGNFTLRGRGRGQWRASAPCYSGPWTAHPRSSDRWNRDRLIIWDEIGDAEIQESISKQRRLSRLRLMQSRVEKLRVGDVTDIVLDALEAALPEEKQS